jgi:hypothetical protein
MRFGAIARMVAEQMRTAPGSVVAGAPAMAPPAAAAQKPASKLIIP